MDDLSLADIRQALEHALADLNTVHTAWMDDADTVRAAAMSLDPNRRRHGREPERVDQLRGAMVHIEWLLSDIADADDPPES
jgi:hypothetical protein